MCFWPSFFREECFLGRRDWRDGRTEIKGVNFYHFQIYQTRYLYKGLSIYYVVEIGRVGKNEIYYVSTTEGRVVANIDFYYFSTTLPCALG